MEAFIERANKTKRLRYSGNVAGLLKILGINPDDVLVVRNDELLTQKDRLKDSDRVQVLSIISGG